MRFGATGGSSPAISRSQAHSAVQCAAIVLPGALAKPFGRDIACSGSEAVLDEFAWDDEIAPVAAHAAQDDVRMWVVGVPVVDRDPL